MPLNNDFQQVLLHLLNFVILFGALYFLLYGPVKKFMEKREAEYRETDEKTKANLADSESAKAKYEAMLENAELEIEKRRSDAQKDADRSAQAVIDEAKVTADGIIKKARAEAQKEHDELISSARKEVAAAAVEMAEKIVSESTLDSYDTFIAATRKEESND